MLIWLWLRVLLSEVKYLFIGLNLSVIELYFVCCLLGDYRSLICFNNNKIIIRVIGVFDLFFDFLLCII